MLCPYWERPVLSLPNLFLLTCPMQGTISHCQVRPKYGIPGNISWQKKINTGGGGSSDSFHRTDGSPGSLYSEHETQAVWATGMWVLSCGKSYVPPFQEFFLILYHSCDTTQTNVAIDTVLSQMELGTTHYQNILYLVIFLLFSFLCYFNTFYSLEFCVFVFCVFMFVFHLMKKKTEKLFDYWWKAWAVLDPTACLSQYKTKTIKSIKFSRYWSLVVYERSNVWSTGLKIALSHYELPFNGKVNLKCLDNPADILHICFIS